MCKRLHSDTRHLMKPDSIVPFHWTDWDYLPNVCFYFDIPERVVIFTCLWCTAFSGIVLHIDFENRIKKIRIDLSRICGRFFIIRARCNYAAPLLFFQDIIFSEFTAVEHPQTIRQCDCTGGLLFGRRSYLFYDIFIYDVINAIFSKATVPLSKIFTSQFVSCITVDFQCFSGATAISAG